jgi:cytochrome c2
MKFNLSKLFVLGFIGLGIVMVISKTTSLFSGSAINSIKIPELSQTAQAGQLAFDANCKQCHGENGSGTSSGPPLVNDIYNPGHHDDASFFRAMQKGTGAHHWQFGNMPAQNQVASTDRRKIIQYVRELQEANGILYRPHRM